MKKDIKEKHINCHQHHPLGICDCNKKEKTKKEIKEEIVQTFVEKGADIEHARWAGWQKYLHSLCKKNKDGTLTISKERVIHWEKEIATSYSELSEELKEYDRIETRKYIPLLLTSLDQYAEAKDKKIQELSNLIGDDLYEKHFGKDSAEAKKEELRKKINNLEIDAEAHSKGSCSFSLLSICSAEEQRIKKELLEKL